MSKRAALVSQLSDTARFTLVYISFDALPKLQGRTLFASSWIRDNAKSSVRQHTDTYGYINHYYGDRVFCQREPVPTMEAESVNLSKVAVPNGPICSGLLHYATRHLLEADSNMVLQCSILKQILCFYDFKICIS